MIVSQSKSNSLLRMIRQVVHKEGIPGLYSGIGASVPGSMVYTGVSFYSYDTLKIACKRYNAAHPAQGPDTGGGTSTLQTLGCGMAAGWAGMTASFPMNVVRRRLQVQGMHEVDPSALTSSSSTNVDMKKSRRKVFPQTKLNSHLRQATSKDVLRNAKMGEQFLVPWGRPYQGCYDASVRILTEEGLGSFFRGWTAMTLRIVPASGFSFLGYEWIKRSFGEE